MPRLPVLLHHKQVATQKCRAALRAAGLTRQAAYPPAPGRTLGLQRGRLRHRLQLPPHAQPAGQPLHRAHHLALQHKEGETVQRWGNAFGTPRATSATLRPRPPPRCTRLRAAAAGLAGPRRPGAVHTLDRTRPHQTEIDQTTVHSPCRRGLVWCRSTRPHQAKDRTITHHAAVVVQAVVGGKVPQAGAPEAQRGLGQEGRQLLLKQLGRARVLRRQG